MCSRTLIVALALTGLGCPGQQSGSAPRSNLPTPRTQQVVKLSAGQVTTLRSDLDTLDREIARAVAEDERLASGLNKALIQSELATLRQTRAMLQQRLKADDFGVSISYTVDGRPFVRPPGADQELASVETELAASERSIDAQQQEIARWRGGLVLALAQSTLATMRNTHAMLEQRRAALRYGLPQYLAFNVGSQDRQPRPASVLAPLAAAASQETAIRPSVAAPANPEQARPILALEQNYYGAEPVFRQQCATEWPSDFHMREVCERVQREGVESLRSTHPNGVPTDVFASIRAHCEKEWPTDFHMRTVCEKEQFEGYRHTR